MGKQSQREKELLETIQKLIEQKRKVEEQLVREQFTNATLSSQIVSLKKQIESQQRLLKAIRKS